jgi:hypothetical protein
MLLFIFSSRISFLDIKSFITSAMFSFNISYCSLGIFPLINSCFREMAKQDILNFLNSLRKSIFEDESQRWIGSYNVRQIILNKFFRWLYNSDEPHQN